MTSKLFGSSSEKLLVHFVIVDHSDNLLFEYQTFHSENNTNNLPFDEKSRTTSESFAILLNHHFLLFASLDIVDILIRETSSLFLRVIEKLRDISISAYVIPSGKYACMNCVFVKCQIGLRFLLIHSSIGLSEESIREFFIEVHESYISMLLNPLFDNTKPFSSKSFNKNVSMLAKKHLTISST